MCDYSLESIASRPAKIGEKLVSTQFRNSITRKGRAACSPVSSIDSSFRLGGAPYRLKALHLNAYPAIAPAGAALSVAACWMEMAHRLSLLVRKSFTHCRWTLVNAWEIGNI